MPMPGSTCESVFAILAAKRLRRPTISLIASRQPSNATVRRPLSTRLRNGRIFSCRRSSSPTSVAQL